MQGRQQAKDAPLLPVNGIPSSAPVGTNPRRLEFAQFLESREFLDVAWNISDALEYTPRFTWKTRIKNFFLRVRASFFSNLGDMLLSLPSIAILPLIVSIPYLPYSSRTSVLYLCPVLVIVSILISLMRLRTVGIEMESGLTRGQVPETRSGTQQMEWADRGPVVFHPPFWSFLRKELNWSWICGTIEVIGLLMLAFRSQTSDIVFPGFWIFFAFSVPLIDAMRCMFDAKALDKVYSIIAYNNIAVLPTRRPLKFDPVTGKFDQTKQIIGVTFASISSLKLGITALKDEEQNQTVSNFPYVFHLIFRTRVIEEGATDSSKLLCFRLLPSGIDRERDQFYSVGVSIPDMISFLEILKSRLVVQSIGTSVSAMQRFLMLLEPIEYEYEKQDKEWLDTVFAHTWDRQASSSYAV
mmetsp:Transcript_12629/g.20578  ORF Transcript_12629/g.20578 Transcript_12629/m.20578 type:complete len:411 (+) Transcript_12629:117-1349(+)